MSPAERQPTYYETLGLDPSADAGAVERTCDELYDRWRRLVTHHDLADQARVNLKAVETIRSTLLDARTRAAYDQGIGLSRSGGLADPGLLQLHAQSGQLPSGSPMAPPPVPADARLVAQRRPVTNPWNCPTCGVDNIERAKFCVACAARLIRECLACHNVTSLVSTGICWECGTRHEDEEARLTASAEAARERKAQSPALRDEYQELERSLTVALTQQKDLIDLQMRGIGTGQFRDELQEELDEVAEDIDAIGQRMNELALELGEPDEAG
jgi:hypothetical protein